MVVIIDEVKDESVPEHWMGQLVDNKNKGHYYVKAHDGHLGHLSNMHLNLGTLWWQSEEPFRLRRQPLRPFGMPAAGGLETSPQMTMSETTEKEPMTMLTLVN